MADIDTFASRLRHFSRSVDIVDDDIFERIRQLIYKYVRDELGAAYFEVMRKQVLDSTSGLKTFWSSADRDHIWPVSQPDGSYTNVITLAVGQQQALWVVGQDGKSLVESEKLEDEWSDNSALPSYKPMADQTIHTLVALPLRRARLLGVCYFECSKHMGITDVAKTELQMLAESITILLELYEENRFQSAQTSVAISELSDRLQSARFPRLTRPHFFVASSNRADPTVKNVISEVLDKFSDKIESTDWAKMSESGNINAQIALEIMQSRFGICYLSEPIGDEGDEGVDFRDNANVIFEAGMLHARTAMNDPGDQGEPKGWIPLREEASPPPPFDFAAERILLVPRFGDGRVNEERLREVLTNRIDSLLSNE